MSLRRKTSNNRHCEGPKGLWQSVPLLLRLTDEEYGADCFASSVTAFGGDTFPEGEGKDETEYY